MGSFFSNLHIHKTAELDMTAFPALLTEILNAQGFLRKSNQDDADFTVYVCDAGEQWISLCSDGLDFYTDEATERICNPLSERLSTDVLTISCFDSDCLILNCINRRKNVDAYIKIGRCPEIKRRSTPAKWKGLVNDFEKWKAVLKQDYVFAEEALDGIEPLLGLAPEQGQFCDDLISEGYEGHISAFYFALPQDISKPLPPKLTFIMPSVMPCEIGKDQCLFVINTGGKSKGVAIVFSGSYVEHEEIRFRDVQFEYALDQFPRKTIPLQLEKRQTQDGQWVYYAQLPDFPMREGMKKGLPWRREMAEEEKREFGVRFTPEGNPRKLLDITVHFIPLKNPEGQCGWRVWQLSGSKRAYIEEYNRGWNAIIHNSPYPPADDTLLNADDYDMDE